ncbi:MAG: hypothetical protein DIU80_025180 [Chloroflexota bacterium]
MSHENATTADVMQRLGIVVTQDPRTGRGWGWAMSNHRITRPWVGTYASRDEATAAALDWLLDTAWRGILTPILQAAANEGVLPAAPDHEPLDDAEPDDERLLEPWLRAFAPALLTEK